MWNQKHSKNIYYIILITSNCCLRNFVFEEELQTITIWGHSVVNNETQTRGHTLHSLKPVPISGVLERHQPRRLRLHKSWRAACAPAALVVPAQGWGLPGGPGQFTEFTIFPIFFRGVAQSHLVWWFTSRLTCAAVRDGADWVLEAIFLLGCWKSRREWG